MESYINIDKNMIVEKTVGDIDVIWRDVREEPFMLHGLYNPETEPIFHRLPTGVAEAIRISRFTRRIVHQNIAFALTVKAAFLLLGIFGWTNMWAATFADVGVAVLAILNAMRTLRYGGSELE